MAVVSVERFFEVSTPHDKECYTLNLQGWQVVLVLQLLIVGTNHPRMRFLTKVIVPGGRFVIDQLSVILKSWGFTDEEVRDLAGIR